MIFDVANAAGLEAHNAPYAAHVAHIDARVAIATRKITFRAGAGDFGAGSDECRVVVEAHFAVADFDGLDVKSAAAHTGQRLLLGLQCAVGRDSHVIGRQQGIHRGNVAARDRVPPSIFEAVDFMANPVPLSARHRVMCGRVAKRQHRQKTSRKNATPEVR